jgi:hypothetical protein
MNKMFPKDVDKNCQDFTNFVEPKIRERLNIVIGIIAVNQKIIRHKALNQKCFTIKGIKYFIGTDPYQKKEFAKVFLNASFPCNILNRKIDFSPLLGKVNLSDDYQKDFPNIDKYIYLATNLKSIISSKLNLILNKYDPFLTGQIAGISKAEKLLISQIFCYSEFFQTPNSKWYYGLNFAKALNITICPYCNRSDIKSTFDVNGTKITGPTIDHFLLQSDYPFLVMSFYNLVPSCFDCNTKLKHEKKFDLIHFLYPFEDSIENCARFKIYQNDLEVKNKLTSTNDLKVKIECIIPNTDARFLKLYGNANPKHDQNKGTLNVFQTEEIYNQKNLGNAEILIDKHQTYPKTYVDSIFKSMLEDQGLSKKKAYRVYYEAELHEENFNDMSLSRFKRDLNIQLNEIYGYDHTKID